MNMFQEFPTRVAQSLESLKSNLLLLKFRRKQMSLIKLIVLASLSCFIFWTFFSYTFSIGIPGKTISKKAGNPPTPQVASDATAGSASSLLSSPPNYLEKIPPIIHQTWKNKNKLPKRFKEWSQSCIDVHSKEAQEEARKSSSNNPKGKDNEIVEWQHKLWDDKDNLKLVQKYFPWFLDTYKSFPYTITRVDAIRYMILYLEGGFFIDLDMECLKSLESFRSYPLVMARMGYDKSLGFVEHSLPNSWLGSVPRHPFWLFLLNRMNEANSVGVSVERAGGSIFLSKGYDAWAFLRKRDVPFIEFIAPELIYPYDWRVQDDKNIVCSAQKNTFDTSFCKVLIPVESVMVSYWTKTWGNYGIEEILDE